LVTDARTATIAVPGMRRTALAIQHKAAIGEYNGGQAPYGYRDAADGARLKCVRDCPRHERRRATRLRLIFGDTSKPFAQLTAMVRPTIAKVGLLRTHRETFISI